MVVDNDNSTKVLFDTFTIIKRLEKDIGNSCHVFMYVLEDSLVIEVFWSILQIKLKKRFFVEYLRDGVGEVALLAFINECKNKVDKYFKNV